MPPTSSDSAANSFISGGCWGFARNVWVSRYDRPAAMCGGSSEVGLLSRLSRNACTRKTRTRAPAASPSSRDSRFAEGIAAHFNIRSAGWLREAAGLRSRFRAGLGWQGLGLQSQGRAARYGEAHHGDQPPHAAAPVREQVDILPITLDGTD